jgi:hypothetical protein
LAKVFSFRLLGKRTRGLFRTFDDFEFCAAFTDRKNTPTFAAVMVIFFAIFMLKIRLKVCCNFGRTSQGDVVGRVSAHYIALLIYTCFCAYTIQARSTTNGRIRLEKRPLAYAYSLTRTRLRALAYAHLLTRTHLRALAHAHSLTRTCSRAFAYAHLLTPTRLHPLAYAHSLTRTRLCALAYAFDTMEYAKLRVPKVAR